MSSFFPDLLMGIRSIFKISFLKNSLFTLALIFIATAIFLPQYWKYDMSAQHASFSHGVTSHGHPWLGAKNPILTIEEYTDYQCFECYKNHFQIRKLIKAFPDKIRLVHRNYPIDHEFNPYVAPEPYHIGSGRLALLAIAALQQDKFWEANDKIYSMMQEKSVEIDINRLAEELDLDLDKLIYDIQTPSTFKSLEDDIKAGLRHEISGTPTYVIEDIAYEGWIPSEIIKSISH